MTSALASSFSCMACTEGSEKTLRTQVLTSSTLSRTFRMGLVWLGERGGRVWSEEGQGQGRSGEEGYLSQPGHLG